MKLSQYLAVITYLLLFSGAINAQDINSNIKFSKAQNPVPAQAKRDSYQDAGDFYHAQYSGSAWGDYNNDGYLDLYYADKDDHVGNAIYSNLYLNNTDGTFTRQSASTFSPVSFSCPVWIDINNDGLLDMVLPGLSEWGHAWADADTKLNEIVVKVYINKGNASGKWEFDEMEDPGIIPLYNGRNGGKGHNWVSAGDYDNDGFTDIIMTGFDENARSLSDHPEEAVRAVYLYRNINGERFEIQEFPLKNSNFHGLTDGSVQFVDLDGDGFLDIFSTGYGETRNSEAYIYWNNGDGTFTEDTGNQFVGITDSSCLAADLSCDGLPDLIMPGYHFNTKSKQFNIYRNLGNRKFVKVENLGLEGVDGGQVSVGDVNNDGFPDILIGGHGSKHEHTTWIYLNDGDFGFKSYGAYYDDLKGTNSFQRITHGSHHLVDYDNDGFLDAWMFGWINGNCAKGCSAVLYHNDSESKGFVPNKTPSSPDNLKATPLGNNKVAFSWSAPEDDVTPQGALRYNLFVKKKGSDKIAMTVPADINTGFVKVANISGDIRICTYQMIISEGGDYEWGVQAIDSNNAGGAFAKSEFNLLTGINEIDANNISLVWDGNNIKYTANEGALLEITSVDGRKIESFLISGNGSYMPDISVGLYIATLTDGLNRKLLKIIK
ncbi:MAG: VCBS repeat-containing protein [Muribaculaceae bacterium]|nr:VCBS repeat-containing protein [Muribaculaceae bacterium]